MVALLLGDRSAPAYIKLPSAIERNIGARPRIRKSDPVRMKYGTKSPTPRGKVIIVIARSCRYDSPDRRKLVGCCISRSERQILLSSISKVTRENRAKPLERILDMYRATVAVHGEKMSGDTAVFSAAPLTKFLSPLI